MKNGVVYTPNNIVKFMLNSINYKGIGILGKHIIDNSAGEGAFLVEVVKRYIKSYKNKYKNLDNIKNDLENFIHGVEIDRFAHKKLIYNLNSVIKNNNINKKIKWDIKNKDSLIITDYYNKMDYVVGNPPYIRLRHMNYDAKGKFEYSKVGMTDLYLIFFEIGKNMLNENGKLIYITPNSFFNSKVGYTFRKDIIQNNLIEEIINLGHYNPFVGVTTYTAITKLNKNKNDTSVIFSNYNGESYQKYLNFDFYVNDIFYFKSLSEITEFANINTCENNFVRVKNGIMTNLNGFFINKQWDNKWTKDIYKISTGKWFKIFFPYDFNGKLIPFQDFSQEVKEKLNHNKEVLIKRDLRKQEWYEFGRTQAIKDTFINKICINPLIKNIDSIKLMHVDNNSVVYSGYYIIYQEWQKKQIEEILLSEDFIRYVKSLNKERNGGYYSYSSKDLEKYLNYNLDKNMKK